MSEAIRFEESLAHGLSAEDLFIEAVGNGVREGGRDYDVRLLSSSERMWPLGSVELKTDRVVGRTGNFAFKRLSNIKDPMSLRGPWKAAALQVDWFVLHLPHLREFWFFRPCELAQYLDSHWHRYKSVNRTTQGFHEQYDGDARAVPVAELTQFVRWVVFEPGFTPTDCL